VEEEEEVKLPCEFCAALVPLSQFEQHQLHCAARSSTGTADRGPAAGAGTAPSLEGSDTLVDAPGGAATLAIRLVTATGDGDGERGGGGVGAATGCQVVLRPADLAAAAAAIAHELGDGGAGSAGGAGASASAPAWRGDTVWGYLRTRFGPAPAAAADASPPAPSALSLSLRAPSAGIYVLTDAGEGAPLFVAGLALSGLRVRGHRRGGSGVPLLALSARAAAAALATAPAPAPDLLLPQTQTQTQTQTLTLTPLCPPAPLHIELLKTGAEWRRFHTSLAFDGLGQGVPRVVWPRAAAAAEGLVADARRAVALVTAAVATAVEAVEVGDAGIAVEAASGAIF